MPNNFYNGLYYTIDVMDNISSYMVAPYKFNMSNFTMTLLDTDSLAIQEIDMPDGSIVNVPQATYVVSGNGDYTFTVKDNLGKTTSKTISLNVDTVKPTLNITNVPTAMVKSQVIHINAIDNASGIKQVTLPNGEIRTVDTEGQSFDMDYNITANGDYTFLIQDYAGNTTSQTIHIDKIDNTVSSAVVTADKTSWTNKNVILSIIASDSQSGIKSITMPNGAVVNNATANYTATQNGTVGFTVEDKAENIETVYYNVSNIDKVAPTAPILTLQDNNLTSDDAIVSTPCVTDDSGIAGTYYKVNNGFWMNDLSSALAGKADGSYCVYAKTVDNAGNESNITELDILISIKSTDAVIKAETTKVQSDIDNARSLVNTLNGSVKTALTIRLDSVQVVVDLQTSIDNATATVQQAEQTKSQADSDMARNLTSSLPEGTIKNDLNEKLDIIDLIISSIDLVNKGNLTGAQTQIDNTTIMISVLADSTIKAAFTDDIVDIQQSIVGYQALVDATAAVVKAETSKVKADVDIASGLVGALGDSGSKTALQARIDAIDVFDIAGNLIDQAAGTETVDDIEAAEAYLATLPATLARMNMYDVLRNLIKASQTLAIQVSLTSYFNNALALHSVNVAVTSKSTTDIAAAQKLINALSDILYKATLQGKLSNISTAPSSYAVQLSVIKAEGSKSTADIAAAQLLVNGLVNSAFKTSLNVRLARLVPSTGGSTGGQSSYVQVKAAETATTSATYYITRTYYDTAFALVEALSNSTNKTSDETKLTALKKILEAQDLVITAETSITQVDIDAARLSVNSLVNSVKKSELLKRVSVVQAQIVLAV